MALTHSSKQISSLKINKIPSAAVYDKMVAQNLINDDELYLVQETEHVINKYTFTATAGQSTFTIPFDFEDSSALTVYYNGVMMKETDNYTVSGKVITLAGFTAEVGDYLTVMGIEGAAAIDFGQEAIDAVTTINNSVAGAKKEINDKVIEAENTIQDLLNTVPDDVTLALYKNKTNIMTSTGEILMDVNYTPLKDNAVVTKGYVDNNASLFSSTKQGVVPASGGGNSKYLRADGIWSELTPAVGNTSNYAIYIGNTEPASGTTPLIWIDTTADTGVLKYRATNTSIWTAVPVAFS